MVENAHSRDTDEFLISQYLETQEQRYFDQIYHRYATKVYAKCISLLKDESLALDAVQEIFMKIILKLSNFGGRSKLSTWIYAITYNYCIDQVRRQQRSIEYAKEDMSQYDREEEVADSVLLEMNMGRLKIILERLAIKDKSILLMKYQDEMSIVEISEGLGKSPSAVKMQLKRAKERVKSIYEELYSEYV